MSESEQRADTDTTLEMRVEALELQTKLQTRMLTDVGETLRKVMLCLEGSRVLAEMKSAERSRRLSERVDAIEEGR